MSNEITLRASMKVVNGNLEIPLLGSSQFQDDQTNARGGQPGTATIGTSEEDVSFGDLTAPGWVWLVNLDDTNYVKYGPKSGAAMVLFGEIYPGKRALFFLGASVTLRMVADTAACDVMIVAADR